MLLITNPLSTFLFSVQHLASAETRQAKNGVVTVGTQLRVSSCTVEIKIFPTMKKEIKVYSFLFVDNCIKISMPGSDIVGMGNPKSLDSMKLALMTDLE